ncbi:4,5-DOPA dioxygenase extradiol [Fistulifera solaris]|uniref:4,5-DOPA dioxygenase extradiol n=1 Tax=Fistulifera solaris TaxID=1519565 RepID=A0A1Z5KK24_FISSO|nr:4,5-DOPA dioxygenase extradiol [Fistulifera solaris]|eukprot:GAX26674.1 4,5-DOPA dioxygenase extradiol [Fistulifera solaris]
MMRMPALFVNHGGGPMPLMGRQPMIAHHLQESVTKYITEKPRAIVVISAHHEANPIAITSSAKPSMYFDYYGFPPETYEFKYPAPGNPELARQIQNLLSEKGIESQLDAKRGLDHGAFVPLMLMYPDADIPVVCVSLHSSLSPDIHLALGNALAPLQDQGVLLLGSGFAFHNFDAMRNPDEASYKKSNDFNNWLKDAVMANPVEKLRDWKNAPSARFAHPREEHLMPLLVTAAAGGSPQIIYDRQAGNGDFAISGYLFE